MFPSEESVGIDLCCSQNNVYFLGSGLAIINLLQVLYQLNFPGTGRVVSIHPLEVSSKYTYGKGVDLHKKVVFCFRCCFLCTSGIAVVKVQLGMFRNMLK